MSKIEIENEVRFLTHLKSITSKDENILDEVEKYLLSGLANKKNYDGKLTPKIFMDNFFVNFDNSDLVKKIENFFDKKDKMICITGDKGNGKSVFANTLFFQLNTQQNYNYDVIVLDCDKGGKEDYFPIEDLEQKFRKKFAQYVNKQNGNNALVSIFLDLIDFLSKQDVADGSYFFSQEMKDEFHNAHELFLDGWHENEWGKYCYSQRTTKFYEHLHKVNNEINFSTISLRSFIVFVLFILLLICESQNTNKKYIIVFDNLDIYAEERLNRIGGLFSDLDYKIEEFFDNLGKYTTILGRPFFSSNNFIFLVDIRLTTQIYDIKTKHAKYFKNSIFLENNNIFVLALLKKLDYLYKNKIFGNFYDEVKNIIRVFIPETKINEYLEESTINKIFDVHDVKFYFKEIYFPFYNNDFRESVKCIINYYRQLDEKSRIQLYNLPYDNENLYDSVANGVRMQFFKFVFDDLLERGIFNAFGINNLDGKESLIRLILGYLYWNNHHYNKNNGINLLQLLTFLKGTHIKDIATTLYNLSVYHEMTEAKSEAVENWSYLISFKGLKQDFSIESLETLLKDIKDNKLQTIKVSLSKAGVNYFKFVSMQFEFFNSRLNKRLKNNSLFSYDNSKSDNKFDFQIPISDVREALISFFVSKINKGHICCRNCQNCNKDKKWLNEEFLIRDCAMFLRLQDCFRVLEECINYINRYRYYMINVYKTEKDEINSAILDELRLYFDLYEKIFTLLLQKDNQFYPKYDELKKFICSLNPKRELKNGHYGLNKNYEELLVKIKNNAEIYSMYNDVNCDEKLV